MKLSPLVLTYRFQDPPNTTPPGALNLPCRESAAFGDGSHPTTRLCAGAVDLLARTTSISAALDVGTGTGILARIIRARARERRGLASPAPFVAATDIDPVALSAARANARLDLDSEEISIGEFPPDHWGPRFDLVIANILEGPLRELAPKLTRALAPGGTLMISGFTRLQSPGLQEVFRARGLMPAGDAVLDGWVLSSFRR